MGGVTSSVAPLSHMVRASDFLFQSRNFHNLPVKNIPRSITFSISNHMCLTFYLPFLNYLLSTIQWIFYWFSKFDSISNQHFRLMLWTIYYFLLLSTSKIFFMLNRYILLVSLLYNKGDFFTFYSSCSSLDFLSLYIFTLKYRVHFRHCHFFQLYVNKTFRVLN